MTSIGNVRSNGVISLHRPTFWRTSGLLAVVSALALSPVQAKDPVPETKATVKSQAAHAQPESAAIPECIAKLKLSAQQQEQVKEIVHNYDQSMGTVWKQFGDRYMQTISMESSLLAAIEDNLSEPQRQQVRNQRRKTAQYEKAIAATSSKVNQAKATPNEETTKPANAAEEGLASSGVTLTDEQEATADKVQEKYRGQLRSLNRDIQGLHTRLVSLEADKLVEIEKILTKEQLTQLRTDRQNAPAAPKFAVTQSGARKTE